MSSNAGGYGSLTFPNSAARAAWQKARVRYGEWEDWPEGFFSDLSKPFTVGARCRALNRSRSDGGVLTIAVDGTRVELRMDLPEESFNELVGDVASLLRAAEAQRAKGSFVFLGTTGADGDFAFRLELGAGRSRIAEVRGKPRQALYESREYQELSRFVLSSLGERQPVASRVRGAKAPKSSVGDTPALFAVLANPKQVEPCTTAFDALRRRAPAEVAKPLLASLKLAAARKPEKGYAVVTQVDSLLVELARRLDVKAAAPALVQLATSKRAIEVRKVAAELLLDWGLGLKELGRHQDGEYGIGRHSARARLALGVDAAIKAVTPISSRTAPKVLELLGGLADDARGAKKAKRRAFLEQDRRLVELARAAAESGDGALAHAAKEVLRLAPRR